MIEVIGLVLAVVVGALLGLLGGGGSILAVPIFVYVLGLDPKLAIATSLGVVGATSLVGTWRQYRAGNLQFGTGLMFAAGSMLASFLGAKELSQLVSSTVQMVIFGAVMLAAAVLMLTGRGATTQEDAPATIGARLLRVVLPAVAVGILTGLVGVGGGFMIVPALVLFAGVAMKPAIGTSLLVITLNSIAGFAGYLLQDPLRDQMLNATVGTFTMPVYLGLFTALTIVGVFAGTALGKRVDAEHLRRYFAYFLIAMAVFILAQNLLS